MIDRRGLPGVLWVALLSCAGARTTADPAAPERHSIATGSGRYIIEYVLRPEPLPLNQPFEIDAWVRAADGRAIEDVQLTVDARMPSHRHGMNPH